MKLCIHCNTEKDNSEFSPDKCRSDGLYPWCKKCKAEKARALRLSKPVEKRFAEIQCRSCHIKKPRTEFAIVNHTGKTARSTDLLCKECRKTKAEREKQYRLAYVATNKKQIRERASRSRKQNSIQNSEEWCRIKTILLLEHGGCCVECGLQLSEKAPSYCFDFHHVDPTQKENAVGTFIRRAVHKTKNKLERIEIARKEASKCMVLCAICHRKKHKGE